MKYFEAEEYGRVIVIELEREEKLIEGISEKLKELGIKNAVVQSAVGSLSKLVYHRPMGFQESAVDEIVEIVEPMEICSLTGTVIDGIPHFHFSAATPKEIHGGHLENGSIVLYLFEIVLVEIKGLNLERKLTKENVKKLFIKSN